MYGASSVEWQTRREAGTQSQRSPWRRWLGRQREDFALRSGTRRCPEMSNQLWRNRLTATLVVAAVPFAASATAAHAAPSAQAQLATVAKKAPKRNVTAIVQFKPSFSERQAAKLVRAHGGKVTSHLSFIHGLAVKLPAKQAKVLATDSHVVGLTLNSRVHSTGV